MNKKKYTHRSKELDAMIGKKIKITFNDGSVETGTLKDDWFGRYLIQTERYEIAFRKTQIKKAEEV